MKQIKLFKGVEAELSALESEINTWIRESGANVVGISGNVAPQSASMAKTPESAGPLRYAPSDVLIIVTYEADA